MAKFNYAKVKRAKPLSPKLQRIVNRIAKFSAAAAKAEEEREALAEADSAIIGFSYRPIYFDVSKWKKDNNIVKRMPGDY